MKVTQNGRTYDVVIASIPNINPGTKLVGNRSYPRIAQDYAAAFRTLLSLHCDVFLGAHSGYFNLKQKLANMKAGGPNPFIDPDGYRAY